MSTDIYGNIHEALASLAYDVSQARNGIRKETPLWKAQEYLDALAYTVERLRKGEYDE